MDVNAEGTIGGMEADKVDKLVVEIEGETPFTVERFGKKSTDAVMSLPEFPASATT